jgi:hypothetical protein
MKCLSYAFFVLLLAGIGFAQMSPQYAEYSSMSYDPANHILSQTVIVEGSTVGGCYVPCGPPQYHTTCPLPGCLDATHSSTIVNTLVAKGVTYGGTTTSGGHYPFSYFADSFTVIVPGVQPMDTGSGTEGGYVSCSANGMMFAGQGGTGGITDLWEIAFTFLKYVSTIRQYQRGGVTAYDVAVINYCTPATTPPDMDPHGAALDQLGIYKYYDMDGICIRPAPSFPWTCGGIAIGNILQNAPPGNCTKWPLN